MCIILTCEPGVRPDFDLVETCFWNNPDGAGLMWIENGKVQVSKGYTDENELFKMIEDVPKNSRLVIHMRIATSGGIDVGTCHPFPICNDLETLHEADWECDAAIAHNGIIAGMKTDAKLGISDTVRFVSTIVNDLYTKNGINKSVCRRIKRAAPGNRFAVMTSNGKVRRLGDGWETVTKGIHASNSSWRYDRWATKWSKWSYTPSTYTTSTNGNNLGTWGKSNDDWMNDEVYEKALKMCCTETCKMWGDCAAYGPACDDVWDVVTALEDEASGWNDADWSYSYPPTWDDHKDDDWTVWAKEEKEEVINLV